MVSDFNYIASFMKAITTGIYILSVAIYLLTVCDTAAQTIVEGVVLDAETKEPVPYTIVGDPTQNKYSVTDSKGQFILKLKIEADSIIARHVAYETVRIKTNQFIRITIVPKQVELNNVSIQAARLKPKKLGITSHQKPFYVGSALGKVNEFSQIIKTKKPVQLLNANIYLEESNKDSLYVRLSLHRPDKAGKPGSLLLASDLGKQKIETGWIHADISRHELTLNELFFVVFQFFSTDDTDASVSVGGNFFAKGGFVSGPTDHWQPADWAVTIYCEVLE